MQANVALLHKDRQLLPLRTVSAHVGQTPSAVIIGLHAMYIYT
jgi:hypothetical protein